MEPDGIRAEDQEGQGRLLDTLQRLLALEATEITAALTQASQMLVDALEADKIDAFLYEPSSEAIVAVGTSDTPMGRQQHRIGLNRLPIANGGRYAQVFQSGDPFITGQTDQDPDELRGIIRGLGVKSTLAVPMLVGGKRQGVLTAASAQPDKWAPADLRFLAAVSSWVGMVAYRAQLVEQITRDAAERARRVAAEELVDVLAHDLRVPLTPLGGHLSILRMRARREGRADNIHNIEEADRAVERLNSMISDLLDTARLEQGLFALEPQPMDLVALARDTADLLRSAETDIRVRAPAELIVEADPRRLRQALENLLSNALTHSPRGVPVALDVASESREDGQWATLTVTDQGPGIPATLLPTLFTRFGRGDRSAGLGLGLYLARGIAGAHGGALTVESRLGKGSAFRLALPLGPRAREGS